MPEFGNRSKIQLATCHPDLVRVLTRAIEIMDFTVVEGHRTRERQNEYFNRVPPVTKVKWPHSKHNKKPSEAVDIYPYPIDFHTIERFVLLAGVVLACAHEEGVAIRWGGDWDQDFDTADERFRDMPHFELVEPPPGD